MSHQQQGGERWYVHIRQDLAGNHLFDTFSDPDFLVWWLQPSSNTKVRAHKDMTPGWLYSVAAPSCVAPCFPNHQLMLGWVTMCPQQGRNTCISPLH
jgi:hypothetical protein